jgi:hypothetical protein
VLVPRAEHLRLRSPGVGVDGFSQGLSGNWRPLQCYTHRSTPDPEEFI